MSPYISLYLAISPGQVVRGYERSEAGISRASDLDLATLDPHTMASWCALD